MRWLINYIRQCFCKHELEFEECHAEFSNDMGAKRSGVKIAMLCTKCGYLKTKWKF